VIVAGHSVRLRAKNLPADSSWALLDYQRGDPPFCIEHVRAAVAHAAADPNSLLVFSGGATRAEAGLRTEAAGYFAVADHYAWFGHPAVAQRAILVAFARDSFENLLFGICRFREFAGAYPGMVTLVSWAFKQARFHLHRQAIGFPADRYRYLGPNNPVDLDRALASEQRAISCYRLDPYGSGPLFQTKRIERNPMRTPKDRLTSQRNLLK
jgi:hypothetical protein